MNRRQFLVMLAGTAGAVVAAPRTSPQKPLAQAGVVHHASWIMGQIANLWIQTDDPDRAGEAATEAFRAMRELESSLSLHDASSELVAFLDGRAGVPFRASAGLTHAMEAASREWHRTSGAFDPTVVHGRSSEGPEGFLREHGRLVLPSEESRLDFGGIGCGLALDRAGSVLRRMGMDRALLELSGDFLALDAPLGWMGWPMAAADPWTGAPSRAQFDLARSALATSSAVERQTILDPRDGSCAERIAQVTVVAPRAVQADAWSTALVVRRLEGLEGSRAEFDFQGRLSVG